MRESSVQSGQLSRSLAFSALLAASRFHAVSGGRWNGASALRRAGGSVLARVVCGGGARNRNSSVSGMKSLWHFALSQRRMRVETVNCA